MRRMETSTSRGGGEGAEFMIIDRKPLINPAVVPAREGEENFTKTVLYPSDSLLSVGYLCARKNKFSTDRPNRPRVVYNTLCNIYRIIANFCGNL